MENSRLCFSETEQQVQFLATNVGSFLKTPIHFLSPNQPLLLLFLCVLRRGEKEKKIGGKSTADRSVKVSLSSAQRYNDAWGGFYLAFFFFI